MKYLLLILLLLNSMLLVLGQIPPRGRIGSQTTQQRQEELRRQEEKRVEDAFKNLQNLEDSASNDSNPEFLNFLTEPRFTKEQKLLIAPAKDDLTKHSDFLKLPKTGIFKILPNFCGDERVINLSNAKCFNRDNTQLSFYSFRRKIYASLDWSDLTYQDKQLSVGFKSLTIGLISGIGDVSMESLTKDSSEIKSLLELQMPKKLEEISAKKKEIENGIKINKLKFSNKSGVNLNHTYLLRSFAYRTDGTPLNDRRVDMIVVFKIVGIDANEGLTIIWKELYKGETYKV